MDNPMIKIDNKWFPCSNLLEAKFQETLAGSSITFLQIIDGNNIFSCLFKTSAGEAWITNGQSGVTCKIIIATNIGNYNSGNTNVLCMPYTFQYINEPNSKVLIMIKNEFVPCTTMQEQIFIQTPSGSSTVFSDSYLGKDYIYCLFKVSSEIGYLINGKNGKTYKMLIELNIDGIVSKLDKIQSIPLDVI